METDSFGEIHVPSDRLWGAQTQRSLQNFAIGGIEERMPLPVVRSMAIIKKAAARVNSEHFGLDPAKAKAISQAADEVFIGHWSSCLHLYR